MDALRLVAALAVVLFHFTARDHIRWGVPPHEAWPLLSQVTRYGYAGVHLFFVISGFVILMSVWGRTAGQFVASRVSRLYPAYWAAVLLTAALRWWWPSFEVRDPWVVVANLTMLHEPLGVPHVDGVYWTLWVEMQFYLLMLAFILLGVTRRRVLITTSIAPALCTSAALIWPEGGGHLTFLSWAPMFACGMVLFVIYREGHTPGRWLIVAFNAVQGVVLASTQKASAIDVIATGGRVSPIILSTIVVACVGAVAAVALIPSLKNVDWPALTLLGALTYPVYLLHEYFGWALIQALHPAIGRVGTLVAAIAVCLALAWAIHHVIERPIQRPLRNAVERRLTAISRLVSRLRQSTGPDHAGPSGRLRKPS